VSCGVMESPLYHRPLASVTTIRDETSSRRREPVTAGGVRVPRRDR